MRLIVRYIRCLLPTVLVLGLVSCGAQSSVQDIRDRLVFYSAWSYPLSDSTEACILFFGKGRFHEELRESGTQDGAVYGGIDGKWSVERACGKYIIVQHYDLPSLQCPAYCAAAVRAYYAAQNLRGSAVRSEGRWYGIGPFSGFTEEGHIRLPDGRLFWSYGEEYAGDYNANCFETR